MPIDFNQARHAMVEQQVRPWEVLDRRVLDVLGDVKREDFVPATHRKLAFADLALPFFAFSEPFRGTQAQVFREGVDPVGQVRLRY